MVTTVAIIVSFLLGTVIGAILIGMLSAGAYDKGCDDGYSIGCERGWCARTTELYTRRTDDGSEEE